MTWVGIEKLTTGNGRVTDWLESFFELNPELAEEEEKVKKKEYLVDMFRESLPALDMQDKCFYSRKTPEQQREIEKSLWILRRFMSSSRSFAEHHILMVNTMANEGSEVFTKNVTSNREGHPELMWKLLALCGSGKIQRHEAIATPRGIKKNKLEEAILAYYPLMKDDELELFLQINTQEDLEQFFKDNGYDDKTIKEIFKDK